MIKKLFLLLLSLTSLTAVSTNHCSAQNPSEQTNNTQPKDYVADELVAIIGNAPIMLAEMQRIKDILVEQRRTSGVDSELTPEEEALEALMTQKLLAQRGRADSIDKDINRSGIAMQVEEQVSAMVQSLGSVKALEKMYGKAVFQIKRDMEEELLEQQIAQKMEGIIKEEVKMSAADVAAFYRTINVDSLPMSPPQYVYSQIMKSPPATEERKYAIRERLLGFRERILKGEKLSVLARLYSQDPGTKNQGGEDGPRSLHELVAPFSEALQSLEPGQISEVVETEYGFHIIELIDKRGTDVHYRHLLLKPQFEDNEMQEVVNELDSIRKEIKNNTITFEQAAFRFSDDLESKQNGGRVYNLRAYYNEGRDLNRATTKFMADDLAQNAVDDYTHVVGLDVNGVSEPFESVDNKGNKVFKIVKLNQIIPPHKVSLELDYDMLMELARYYKEVKYINEWADKAISKMYIYINPKYRDLKYNSKKWLETCNELEQKRIDDKLPAQYWDNAAAYYNDTYGKNQNSSVDPEKTETQPEDNAKSEDQGKNKQKQKKHTKASKNNKAA